MFSRLLRHARIHLGLFNRDLTTKQAWELEWQRQWAKQFSQPAIQQKVHDYWRKYRHLDEILQIVGAGPNSSILDLGCGISTVLHFLAGRRTGLDPLADHYKRIYGYPADLSVIAGSGEQLPFAADSFDIVFCSNCIDHTTSPPQVIDEIQRVLAPQGHLLLTCEVFRRDLGARNDAHPHTFTAEALEALVQRFTRIKTWESPWYGLQNYVSNAGPTSQREKRAALPEIDRAVSSRANSARRRPSSGKRPPTATTPARETTHLTPATSETAGSTVKATTIRFMAGKAATA